MPRNIPPALQTRLESDVTSPAICIKITLTNGVPITITSHDQDIELAGESYSSLISFVLSSIKSNSDFSVDNAEIEIPIDNFNGPFTRGLVLSQEFRDAEVEIILCDWEDIAAGFYVMKRGNVGDVEVTDELKAKVQIRGLTQKLNKATLEAYSRTCRATFGDKRCGYITSPTRIRVPGKDYKTSDWYLNPIFTAVPLTNNSFEANGLVTNSTAGVSGWSYGLGSYFKVSNTLPGGDGAYYLEGGSESATPASGAVFTLYQEFSTSSLGMTPTDVDQGLWIAHLDAAMVNTILNDRTIGRIGIAMYDAANKPVMIKYTDYEYGKYAVWRRRDLTVLVPSKVRKLRFILQTQKNYGVDAALAFDGVVGKVFRNELSALGTTMYKVARIPALGLGDLVSYSNKFFDAQGAVTNVATGITGWTQNGNFTVASVFGPLSPPPNYGTRLLKGGNNFSLLQSTYTLKQTINIASGSDILVLKAVSAQRTAGNAATVSIQFKTASNTDIGTPIVNFLSLSGIDTFTANEFTISIPLTATKYEIILAMTSPSGTSACEAVISGLPLWQLNLDIEAEDDPSYGRTSTTSVVSLGNTVGQLQYDGALYVKTYPIPFAYGTVQAITNNKTFEVTGISLSNAEMNGGRITFMSGQNSGKTFIVRGFNPTTSFVVTYTPIPFPMAIGDRFVYSRGCDKDILTCGGIFENSLNFRGEPYLPGTGKIIEYITQAKDGVSDTLTGSVGGGVTAPSGGFGPGSRLF